MINYDMNVQALYCSHYSGDDAFYCIAYSIKLKKPTTVKEFINFIKTTRIRSLNSTNTFYITESKGIFADKFFEEETDPLIFSALKTNEDILGYVYIDSNGCAANGVASRENVFGELGNRQIKEIKLFVRHPDNDMYIVEYKHILVLEALPKFKREIYGQRTYISDMTAGSTFRSYEVDCLNSPTVKDAIDWLRGRDDVPYEAIIAFSDKDVSWCFVINNRTEVVVCDRYSSNLISRYEKCRANKMYLLYNSDDVVEFISIKVDKLPTLFETR